MTFWDGTAIDEWIGGLNSGLFFEASTGWLGLRPPLTPAKGERTWPYNALYGLLDDFRRPTRPTPPLDPKIRSRGLYGGPWFRVLMRRGMSARHSLTHPTPTLKIKNPYPFRALSDAFWGQGGKGGF